MSTPLAIFRIQHVSRPLYLGRTHDVRQFPMFFSSPNDCAAVLDKLPSPGVREDWQIKGGSVSDERVLTASDGAWR